MLTEQNASGTPLDSFLGGLLIAVFLVLSLVSVITSWIQA